jgi:hypothetical protein
LYFWFFVNLVFLRCRTEITSVISVFWNMEPKLLTVNSVPVNLVQFNGSYLFCPGLSVGALQSA